MKLISLLVLCFLTSCDSEDVRKLNKNDKLKEDVIELAEDLLEESEDLVLEALGKEKEHAPKEVPK